MLQEDRGDPSFGRALGAFRDFVGGPEEAERTSERDGVVVADPLGADVDGVVPFLGVDEVGVDVRDVRGDLEVEPAVLCDGDTDRCELPCVSFRRSSVTIAYAETVISVGPLSVASPMARSNRSGATPDRRITPSATSPAKRRLRGPVAATWMGHSGAGHAADAIDLVAGE